MKRRVRNVIKKIEEIYYGLRQENQDQDEHWLLANTWLTMYGATPQARQKGEELTRFTAYKDTHQFAILDFPQSIRALALYIHYKESGLPGELYARRNLDFGVEYAKIMGPVFQALASNCFFDKYKEKNPKTLSALQGRALGSVSFQVLALLESYDEEPDAQLLERYEKEIGDLPWLRSDMEEGKA